jgi:hypothetical protein
MGISRKYFKDDPAWAWRDQIKVGDILSTPSGDERVVREAIYYKPDDRFGRGGKINYIVLAIRNCSWTGRGCTFINRSDIRARRFAPTGRTFEVLTDVRTITCCEAKILL